MVPRKPRKTSRPRSKSVIVDQAKLDEARRILAADSETTTVDEALDSIVFAEELVAGLRAVRDAGGLEYFDAR